MDSVLRMHPQLGQIFLVTGSILAALGGIALLLLFMFVRRAIERLRARRFDAMALEIHNQWREIVRGVIPYEEWRGDILKREIVQSIVIQEINAAVDKDRAGLQEFLRSSGLITACIREVHKGHGLARRRAMLALGEGRNDDAWQDLLAAQRLGRLIGRTHDSLCWLVAVSIESVTHKAELASPVKVLDDSLNWLPV